MKTKIYKGFIINPVSASDGVIYYPEGSLVVSDEGKVLFCGESSYAEAQFPDCEIIDHHNGIIMPGLIDLHTHLPQYPAAGCGRGSLLQWLENYIFPLEARYSDTSFAEENSRIFFDSLISAGTTTAVIYTSIHKKAADIAFQKASEAGIRAFIGNSLMDTNVPTELVNDPKILLKNVKELINKWHGQDNERLNFIMTPRYAGCCSMNLMKKCADIATQNGIHIQTHLAENREELSYVLSQFPGYKNYTEIYKSAGLLTQKTILAHCIYLAEEEIKVINNMGAAVAHCPTSNRFLQSGVMPLRKYLTVGMRTGLGTDVAGGYSLSMLNEMKEAIESSKTWNIINHGSELPVITPEEALCMATIGNAEILGIGHNTGNLQNEKDADFIILDADKILKEKIYKTNADILSKIIYKENSIKVKATFVRGRNIFNT